MDKRLVVYTVRRNKKIYLCIYLFGFTKLIYEKWGFYERNNFRKIRSFIFIPFPTFFRNIFPKKNHHNELVFLISFLILKKHNIYHNLFQFLVLHPRKNNSHITTPQLQTSDCLYHFPVAKHSGAVHESGMLKLFLIL